MRPVDRCHGELPGETSGAPPLDGVALFLSAFASAKVRRGAWGALAEPLSPYTHDVARPLCAAVSPMGRAVLTYARAGGGGNPPHPPYGGGDPHRRRSRALHIAPAGRTAAGGGWRST